MRYVRRKFVFGGMRKRSVNLEVNCSSAHKRTTEIGIELGVMEITDFNSYIQHSG